ncbi:MAG: hypothetical protein ACETWB_00740, partial [Anaerolineae bacterium]
LVESGSFGILDAADGYILLKRGLAGRTHLPDEFYDFARVQDPHPQYPMIIDFGPGPGRDGGPLLRFLGFDLIDDYKWQWSKFRLYWQIMEEMDRDYWLYPFFLDEAGGIIEDTTQRPMVVPIWYPTSRWRQGEVIATETLPWNLGDRFSLALGVLEGDEWGNERKRLPAHVIESDYVLRSFDTWIKLLSFERKGARLQLIKEKLLLSPPPMEHPLQANLGDQVALLGYDLIPDIPPPGAALRLTLYWQALSEMGRDYTVFVHLLAPDGYLVAQHDGPPQGGALSTSTWLKGEVVADEHILPLDPALPSGHYQLEAGMYLLETLERLPVTNEKGQVQGDKVILGTVKVEE